MEACISNVEYDNSRFEAVHGLPQPHVDLLVSQRRVYGTEATLTGAEARRHLSYRETEEEPIEFTDGEYGGVIVVSRPGDIVAASRIIQARPFGEAVWGLVTRCTLSEDGWVRSMEVFPPPYPFSIQVEDLN